MRVGTGGTTSVQGLQSPETLWSTSTLEATTALTSGCLDDLELAVKRMDFGRDIEDAGVGLVVPSDLSCQSPIVGAASQIQGLVIR